VTLEIDPCGSTWATRVTLPTADASPTWAAAGRGPRLRSPVLRTPRIPAHRRHRPALPPDPAR